MQATEADLPAIEGLLRELIDATGNRQALDVRAAAENLPVLLHGPHSHVLVARHGDTAVGFIHATVRQTALHSGRSGLIDEVVVARSHRGRGIGRLLVSAAADRCRELGCCELEVSTEKANTAAREFYAELGFEEEAVLLEMDLRTEDVT